MCTSKRRLVRIGEPIAAASLLALHYHPIDESSYLFRHIRLSRKEQSNGQGPYFVLGQETDEAAIADVFAKQRSTPEEDASTGQRSVDQNAFVADTQTPFYGNVIGRAAAFEMPYARRAAGQYRAIQTVVLA